MNNSTLSAALLTTAAAVGAGFYLYKRKKGKTPLPTTTEISKYLLPVEISLPQWLRDEYDSYHQEKYETEEDCMKLAVYLSRRNIREGTGGPFGCTVFRRTLETNQLELVSVGVNQVVGLINSTLHGEMVAIQFAQKILKSFTLFCCDEQEKTTRIELYTSCEPCAMCLGAVLWSGVSKMVCGATKMDAEAIGFDEGPVFPQSYQHLNKAGIEVVKSVLKDEAASVLQEYHKTTGLVYNRSASSSATDAAASERYVG